jgi:EpsD family peptidyl-prolyl cis-trans isomerase
MRQLFWLIAILCFAVGPSVAVAERAAVDQGILATVNGVAITQADVDRALSFALAHNDKMRVSEQLKKDIVDELIVLALIEQRMAQTGLLRSPSVQGEIELSRRSLLKRIFLEQVVGQKTEVKAEDIDRFVAEHPDFFDNRKTYFYSDLKIAREARVDVSRIKGFALSANSKTVEQNKAAGGAVARILGYVQAVGGDFTSFRGYRSSEQIDPGLLKDLSTLELGKFAVNDTAEKGFIHVLELYAVHPDPVDPAQARPQIARGLAAERAKKVAEGIIAKMRADADIRFGTAAAEVVGRTQPSSVGSEREHETFHRNAPTGAKATLLWLFALFVLVPAALLQFHWRTVAQRRELYLVDYDTFSLARNRLKLFSYTPAFEIGLAVAMGAMFIWTSVIMLNAGLPLATSKTLGLLGALALAFALTFCFLLFRFWRLLPTALTSNRWAGLVILAMLQVAALLSVDLWSL